MMVTFAPLILSPRRFVTVPVRATTVGCWIGLGVVVVELLLPPPAQLTADKAMPTNGRNRRSRMYLPLTNSKSINMYV
jgi:hypothetical protein